MMSTKFIPMRNSKNVILGIDPGLKRIGFGIISQQDGEFSFRAAGLLIPETKKTLAKTKLFLTAGQSLQKLVKKFKPQLLAIEKIYFGQNASNALNISELRGVLLFLAAQLNLPVQELSPTEIKFLICGYGRADKQSIRKMVGYNLILPPELRSKDAVDALAIALAGCLKEKSNPQNPK